MRIPYHLGASIHISINIRPKLFLKFERLDNKLQKKADYHQNSYQNSCPITYHNPDHTCRGPFFGAMEKLESTDPSQMLTESVSTLRSMEGANLRALCKSLRVDVGRCVTRDDLVEALLPHCGDAQHVSPAVLADNLASSAPARVIFLDVDGVLTTEDEELTSKVEIAWPTLSSDASAHLGQSSWLDRRCTQRLVELCASTDSRIVISSNWRLSLTLKAELCRALVLAGLPPSHIVGETSQLPSGRASEITAWLDEHAGLVTNWVVIDDMGFSSAALDGHLIWVNPEHGLCEEHLGRAREILAMTSVQRGTEAEKTETPIPSARELPEDLMRVMAAQVEVRTESEASREMAAEAEAASKAEAAEVALEAETVAEAAETAAARLAAAKLKAEEMIAAVKAETAAAVVKERDEISVPGYGSNHQPWALCDPHAN